MKVVLDPFLNKETVNKFYSGDNDMKLCSFVSEKIGDTQIEMEKSCSSEIYPATEHVSKRMKTDNNLFPIHAFKKNTFDGFEYGLKEKKGSL
jgi:hypothetical protein